MPVISLLTIFHTVFLRLVQTVGKTIGVGLLGRHSNL